MTLEHCTYCHGIRLVGWSGAGPILCPECSRGQDAFTVITQAWREQRAKVVELQCIHDRIMSLLMSANALSDGASPSCVAKIVAALDHGAAK